MERGQSQSVCGLEVRVRDLVKTRKRTLRISRTTQSHNVVRPVITGKIGDMDGEIPQQIHRRNVLIPYEGKLGAHQGKELVIPQPGSDVKRCDVLHVQQILRVDDPLLFIDYACSLLCTPTLFV